MPETDFEGTKVWAKRLRDPSVEVHSANRLGTARPSPPAAVKRMGAAVDLFLGCECAPFDPVVPF